MIQRMLAIWSLVPLPFLNVAWTFESSHFTYCSSLGWRIWSITLLACEKTAIVRQFKHYLALPFIGIGMKTDLFQSGSHGTVFQIFWKTFFSNLFGDFQICCHIECSTFTASSFRIRNSSTGIPSLPLPLFLVMLSKAHLTSHARMSSSRWVVTPSWLTGSLISFLYSSSVYSCS